MKDLSPSLIRPLRLPTHRVGNTIQQNGHQHDRQASFECFSHIEALHSSKHNFAQSRCSDKRGKHHQRQCHHHRLIDPQFDSWDRERNFYFNQGLTCCCAKGRCGFINALGYLSNPKVGKAYDWRQSIDDGCQDRPRRSYTKQEESGNKVNVSRQCLHGIQDRFNDRLESIAL